MVREHLVNSEEFWGKYVIPTIFRKTTGISGSILLARHIWGPTNYLVYQAINRYGEDEVALEFAEKSYDLSWRTGKPISEPTSNTMPGRERRRRRSLHVGRTPVLIGMQQFIDENPWTGFALEHYIPARRSTPRCHVEGASL